MIEESSTLRRSPELMATALGNGDLALLSVANGSYYSANPLGHRIWKLLESQKTVAQLQQLILAEYEVPVEQCRADLQRFLNKMIDEGLVHVLI